MTFSLAVTANAAEETAQDLDGDIVILHTNDVHGAISGYAKVAALKDAYEARGAYVLLMDAGDFIQGDPTVSTSEGATAVELMNLAGYDVASMGNHEFDYGYQNLKDLEADADFTIVDANVLYNGQVAFEDNVVFTAPDGTKIGVFGLDTPETATKAHPAKIQGVTFLAGDKMFDCAQDQVDALEAEGCEYIICLGHLGIDAESTGNRSIDLLEKVDGIDVPMDMYFYNLCYAASYMESYMNMYGMDLDWSMELQEGETVLDVTKDSILENTKSFAVIEKLAQENNVILDEAALSELEAERAETVESLGGEESYRAELAKLGLSEETYDRMCRSDYLYSALEELAATEGSSLYATDEQLIAYAAEQGYMTADHILLLTRDMSTYQELDDETKAEKKALAEELKAKLDAYTGDDLIGYFTELADEYSEDSGRAGNPEGYTFGSGQMVEEFESAAATLGEGEVSEIVESYYGYHIILRKPLDEAKAVDAVRETYFSGLLESRIEDAAVEMNPAVEALDLVDIYDAFSLLMDTDADGDTADDTATENGQEAAES